MIDDNQNPWIDITIAIQHGMVHWPGDMPVELHKVSKIESEGCCTPNVTAISMTVHTATHMDAPLHFIKDGEDTTSLNPDMIIGAAKVITIDNPEKITVEELQKHDILKGDKVLFKTKNADNDWSMKPFIDDYVYLSTEAALYLKECGIHCIGMDYLSVSGKNNSKEVHQILMKSGIHIIEGLHMTNIEPGDYEMICLPLKIIDSDGAPARVILRKY